MLEMTDVLLALDKHYGKFDAAITHSFGGMILVYAMSLGLNIDRCALICPPKDFQTLFDNFQRALTLPDNVMQVVIRKTFTTYGKITMDAINTVKNAKNLTCKGLLIHDEDDIETPWQSSEEISQAWPGAEFITTKGLGHRRIINDQEVISKIVKFVNDL